MDAVVIGMPAESRSALLRAAERAMLERDVLAVVQAAAAPAEPEWMGLADLARDHAQAAYQSAFDYALDQHVRRAHRRLLGVDPWQAAAALVVVFDEPFAAELRRELGKASEAAHDFVEGVLGGPKWGEPGERAREFAGLRRDAWDKTPALVSRRLAESVEGAVREGQSPQAIARRLDEAARRSKAVEGRRAAETEAQVCYGTVMDAALMAQGFKTKRWVSQRDERVRKSHRLCDEQGAIPMGRAFRNGGRYPGDPNLPVEELANCRCYLAGGDK